MARTTHHSRRLRLEVLEDRLAPATFNVTTNLDVVDPADGKRSLREAVNAANNLAGADLIVLPAGVIKIALDGANENLNATGDFDISGAVTIRGAGAGSTIIDAQRKDRVFDVIGPSAARFVDLTLRGGDGANNGGAVQALDADLTFVRCGVFDNRGLNGGGINAENGDVTATDSTIARNVAQGNGGGMNLTLGTLTMTGSVIRRNIASAGGGILVTTATLTKCTVSGNSASTDGGGLFAFDSMTLTGCTINGNSAELSGGGIRAFEAVTLTDSTVSGNRSGQNGGGISLSRTIIFGTATLTRSTVSGNHAAEFGGGIDTEFATLTNSIVSGNSAGGGGGGIVGGSATFTRCTISGNSAAAAGGGVLAASATLTNSTVSGNSSATTGGGLFVAFSGTLTNCTIVENTAQAGGGVFRQPVGTFSVKNTIIALNVVTGADPDVSGTFTSQGHNLIGDGTGSTGFTDGVNGDNVGTFASPIDPRLGPLANNGGRTKTHALLAGSRAIDAGDNSLPPPTDQRGLPRKKDGNFNGVAVVDIGAFEK